MTCQPRHIVSVSPDGQLRCVYDDALQPLLGLGSLTLTRASHVEPDAAGQWWADLAPVGGPKLGPFTLRAAALEVEREWLQTNVL